MASSIPTSNATENDTKNWKKRYEKEKKEKTKLLKQMDQYKQKLKKAKFDIEKASNYYKKQIEIFKKKQSELLKHISSTHYSSKKQSLKYVFIEDIKQLKLTEGTGTNCSVDITFTNGDEAIINNIDIINTNESESKNTTNTLREPKRNMSRSNSVPSLPCANIGDKRNDRMEEKKRNNDGGLEAILYDELEKRVQDLDNLINITFGQKYMINEYDDNDNKLKDDVSLAMRLCLIEYVNEIKMRHNQYNLIYKVEQNSSALDDIKHDLKKKQETGLLYTNKLNMQKLHENNGLWRNLLLNFPIDIVGILCFELNDRIHDVQNVRDVLYKTDEALYDNMNDIMTDIKSRHKDSFRSWNKTDNTHKMNEKWKNIIGEVAINNERWRTQIHFEDMPTVIQNNNNNNKQNVANGYKDEPNTATATATATQSTSKGSNNWLFIDENRNEFIDSLKVNQHTVHLLTFVGTYLNRMIPNSDDLKQNGVQELYIPIVTNDAHNVLAACLDGVLFAILLNLVQKDCIDMRALQLPSKPSQPLSESHIIENMIIIFSTLKGLNIQTPSWTMDDYFDANNTVTIILCIVFQLLYKMLDHQINLTTYPELLRLCQNDVERQNAPSITWKKWLNKWLLHLKDPRKMALHEIKLGKIVHTSSSSSDAASEVSEEKKGDMTLYNDEVALFESEDELIRNILHTIDYYDYLILVCCRMDKDFLNHKLPQIQAHRSLMDKADTNDVFTSQLLLECIESIISGGGHGGKTIKYSIEDVASRNPFIQQLLLSDIFVAKSTINEVTSSEKKILPLIMHIATKEETMFIAWINAFFGDPAMYIGNLQYALNDGIIVLSLLDKLKAGCVDWKFVRDSHEIRHKFDKLTNCKLIMDVCCDHFLFNLIGMNGSDIAEGNLKYINMLLWQIMCYGSRRLLSDIKFNGKTVSDKMMLSWMNNRVKQYRKECRQLQRDQDNQDNHKILKLVSIKSLRDAALNDCILFLNLLSSIHSDWINYNLIHNTTSSNNKHKSEIKEERLMNAKYCVTIIRKLGGKLFIEANDICNSDPKAMLCVITCIMIIAAKHSDTDELLINTH